MVDWKIGVLAPLHKEGSSLEMVEGFGLKACQLVNWDMSLWDDELADKVRQEAEEKGITISALWAGVPGPDVWDFVQGPEVLGLVPPKYRTERIAALKEAGRFAKALGVSAAITHLPRRSKPDPAAAPAVPFVARREPGLERRQTSLLARTQLGEAPPGNSAGLPPSSGGWYTKSTRPSPAEGVC